MNFGPHSGSKARVQRSQKKSMKKLKLECTEEEIHDQWTKLKMQLEDFYSNPEKYEGENDFFIVDIYFKPYLKNI